MDSKDRQYGRAFHAESKRLGAEIATGEVASFGQLWGRCRQWRVAQFDKAKASDQLRRMDNTAGSQQSSAETRSLFASPRLPDEAFNCTPILGVYVQLHSQIMAADGEISYGDKGQQTRLVQQTAELNGKIIPLTTLAAFNNEKGERYAVQTSVVPQTKVFGLMGHTLSHHLPALKNRLEQLFAQALSPSTTGHAERLGMLAEMHWLLAHAMLDHRGSAAKSELSIRSIAMAMDMELPPFREHVAPDLIAFVTTLDEFKSRYESEYLESTQSMADWQALPQAEPNLS